MFSSGSGNTVIKSKLISRRMFLLSVIKMDSRCFRKINFTSNKWKQKYKTLSDKNRFREWKLAQKEELRLFDNELASNRQVYQIHLIPKTHKASKVFLD